MAGTTLPPSPTTTLPSATASPYSTDSSISLGLSGATTNWNILARHAAPADPDGALATVADAVWPSAFVVDPGYATTRNDNLLTSAVQTSDHPQTITYEINDRAVWSDGTRITAADFVYTWRAQSGRSSFRDKGRAAFVPESTAGYDRIADVSTSPADPDRVVVTFKRPDADWESLFSPILPAHMAERVGFNAGFTDPVTSLVSGGPFEVQSYQPGTGIDLVRNPAWWGPPANLAAVDISFVSSAPEVAQSLMHGELDAGVTAFDAAVVDDLESTPGLDVSVTPSSTYDDLVINQRHGPLARRRLRLALLLAVDRTALARQAAASGDTGAAPVDNRALLPGQADYADDTSSLVPASGGGAARSDRILAAAGFHLVGGKLMHAGKVVRLTLGVATVTPFAEEDTAAVAAACKQLGISLTILTTAAGTEARRVAAGGYDLAIVAARVGPFPSALAPTYATRGRDNVTGYSNPAMDALIARVERSSGAARTAAVLAVDRLAWSDAVDLPLLAQPTVIAYQSRYVNLASDQGPVGIGWDIASWGIPVRT